MNNFNIFKRMLVDNNSEYFESIFREGQNNDRLDIDVGEENDSLFISIIDRDTQNVIFNKKVDDDICWTKGYYKFLETLYRAAYKDKIFYILDPFNDDIDNCMFRENVRDFKFQSSFDIDKHRVDAFVFDYKGVIPYIEDIDTRAEVNDDHILSDFYNYEKDYFIKQLEQNYKVMVASYKGKYMSLYPIYKEVSTPYTSIPISNQHTTKEYIEAYFDACWDNWNRGPLKTEEEALNKAFDRFVNIEMPYIISYDYKSEEDMKESLEKAKRFVLDTRKDLVIRDMSITLRNNVLFRDENGEQFEGDTFYDLINLSDIKDDEYSSYFTIKRMLDKFMLDFDKEDGSFTNIITNERVNGCDILNKCLLKDSINDMEIIMHNGMYTMWYKDYAKDNPSSLYHIEMMELFDYAEDRLRHIANLLRRRFRDKEDGLENKIKSIKDQLCNIKVKFIDSLKAGNCKSGSLEFCKKHNIDLEKVEEMNADELYNLEPNNPLLLMTILRAYNRQKCEVSN